MLAVLINVLFIRKMQYQVVKAMQECATEKLLSWKDTDKKYTVLRSEIFQLQRRGIHTSYVDLQRTLLTQLVYLNLLMSRMKWKKTMCTTTRSLFLGSTHFFIVEMWWCKLIVHVIFKSMLRVTGTFLTGTAAAYRWYNSPSLLEHRRCDDSHWKQQVMLLHKSTLKVLFVES